MHSDSGNSNTAGFAEIFNHYTIKLEVESYSKAMFEKGAYQCNPENLHTSIGQLLSPIFSKRVINHFQFIEISTVFLVVLTI